MDEGIEVLATGKGRTKIDKSRAAYWNGRNEADEQVSSGIYFYTIQAGEFTATKKMTVVR